jgi:recombinational DNA repair protein RecR
MNAYKTKNAGSDVSIKVCPTCGQPSEKGICAACTDKIRADALADTVGDAPKARPKPGRSRGR